ncbi:MAG: pyridoxal phosphate-dependent aminotransferase [Puniceicoccales bacterium]|jgi:aspartate/methionine/tyrosine aminotransferase|nr:pyridoxal phosphate-dependent aminotransferase [Puniceicoccales bacterium]
MPAKRTHIPQEENALARAAAELRASGRRVLDLTETNPTRAGFVAPAQFLAEAFAATGNNRYEPSPRGSAAARESVAAYLAGHGARVAPESIHLCASTSEAYGWLLKLLTNPGDAVLVPAPSYPLLEVLASLECVHTPAYALVFRDGRWRVDADALAAAVTPATRAILCVAPNNPTGSRLDATDRAILREIAIHHRIPLIVDEVFLDFPATTGGNADATVAGSASVCSWAGETGVPLFALGGMSKTALLPQVKLAWISTAGPEQWRAAMLPRLDYIADAYLSVNAMAQNAAERLFAAAPAARAPLLERVARNEAVLRAWCAGSPHHLRFLPREAGWMAMLALPRGIDEERSVLDLARRSGVLVHPGFFYDTPAEQPFWVVSLISDEQTLADALPFFDETIARH